jgi:hypothetical protein
LHNTNKTIETFPALLRTTNSAPQAPITVEPTFNWFVSQGGERLVDEPVINPQIGWNTLQLTNPIEIDAGKPLYYGVEVVSHDAKDWPIGSAFLFYRDTKTFQDIPSSLAGGKGNIYSEDSGATWEKLSSLGVDYEYDLFCVQATLAQNPSIPPKERIAGYRILRDGINLKGEGTLTKLTNYTDTIPLPFDQEVCYDIQAFYTSQYTSGKTGDCLTIRETDLKKTANGLKVYPNLIKQNETVRIEFPNVAHVYSTLRIYDISGKTVKEVKTQNQSVPIRLFGC